MTVHSYEDANGEVRQTKERAWVDGKKRFFWHSRTETGWVDTEGDERYLYHLPEVLEAQRTGEDVYVCEGEKDADALRGVGCIATTPPDNGAWPEGLAAPLAGVGVWVCYDNDAAGHERGWWAVNALRAVGARLRGCLRALVGKDVADHLEAGHGVGELVEEEPPHVVPGAARRAYGNGSEGPTAWPGQVGGRLAVRAGDLSRAQPFRFVWQNRVLLGYFNLLVGEEGIGKGNLFAWVAAHITRGTLPGNLDGPRKVLFVGDEDSWDNIWVPRLAAAGGDVGMCIYVDQPLDLTRDTPPLEATIRHEDVAITYFDQLLDNIGYADSWKDKDVRQALAPLRRTARDTDTAMLASLHPNKKASASFRDKVSGTPAFNALSRSSLYLARHPEDDGRVACVRPKGNYNLDPPAWVFAIEGAQVRGKGHKLVDTSRVAGGHEEQLDKQLVLEGGVDKGAQRERGDAMDIIGEYFANGVCEYEAAEILQRCTEDGVSPRTARRARKDMGLGTRKNGSGGWVWYVPNKD